MLTALAGLAAVTPVAEAKKLTFPGAPAFVEVFGPTNPKKVMITIHGGGWFTVGPEAAHAERPEAFLWADRGWTAVNISYRPYSKSLTDVLWFYDRVRKLVGKKVPVCLSGGSAGGHLALMVAVRRSDVACVIAQGAPTDLTTLGRQKASGGPGMARQSSGPALTTKWARDAFGSKQLAELSPAKHGKKIKARVLYAVATWDPFIPWDQAVQLRRTVKRIETMRLAGGFEVDWVHAPISAQASKQYRAAELRVSRAAVKDVTGK